MNGVPLKKEDLFSILGRREIGSLLHDNETGDSIIVDFFHHYPGREVCQSFFILSDDGGERTDAGVFRYDSLISGDEVIRFVVQTGKLLWLLSNPLNTDKCLFLSRVEKFDYFLPALAPNTLQCRLQRISTADGKHEFVATVSGSHSGKDTRLAHLEFLMSSVSRPAVAKMLMTHRGFIKQQNGGWI
jgi:hypothetical protein